MFIACCDKATAHWTGYLDQLHDKHNFNFSNLKNGCPRYYEVSAAALVYRQPEFKLKYLAIYAAGLHFPSACKMISITFLSPLLHLE